MAKQVLNNGETHGVIRGKANDNFTELYNITDSHSAENVSRVSVISHDASVEGSQKIVLAGFPPKSLSVNAVVANASKKISWGVVDKSNANTCTFDTSNAVGSNGVYSYTTSGAIFIVESTGNYTVGTITLDEDGFTITWTKGGTGATGTIDVIYSALTH